MYCGYGYVLKLWPCIVAMSMYCGYDCMCIVALAMYCGYGYVLWLWLCVVALVMYCGYGYVLWLWLCIVAYWTHLNLLGGVVSCARFLTAWGCV